MPLAIDEFVDPDNGRVSRRIFVDEEVYAMELERIFARSWLFIAHESQIPNPGDYLATFMAEDPVFVVRQDDGGVQAFLNSCSHRGMKLCRPDMGNAKFFMCSYHGWTFDRGGNLINVPQYDRSYEGVLDLEKWGLKAVPRVQSYRGLIFANWDSSAPSLTEWLGEMTWYLDAMLDKTPGGSVVLEGMHRWTFEGNWKLAAEQFASDMYHAPVSHGSVAEVYSMLAQDAPQSDGPPPTDEGKQFSSPMGHGAGWYDRIEFWDDEPGMTALQEYDRTQVDQLIERLGEPRVRGPVAAHATIFPNFSFLSGGAATLRVWHPRGPNRIEVYAWVLVDAEAPEEVRRDARRQVTRTFSTTGTWEQDDGDNWSMLQRVSRGAVAKGQVLNYQMALGKAVDDDDEYPGRINDVYADEAARGFYRRYIELMKEESDVVSQVWKEVHS